MWRFCPRIPPTSSRELADNFFYTPRIVILPGETHQFIVTIMPLNETPLAVDVLNEDRHLVMLPEDAIRISIGNRSSNYQLDKDSYTRNPFTKYVWSQVLYPECWWPPWEGSGPDGSMITMRIAELRSTMQYIGPSGGCEGCRCVSGSMVVVCEGDQPMQMTSMQERRQLPARIAAKETKKLPQKRKILCCMLEWMFTRRRFKSQPWMLLETSFLRRT